MRTLLLVTLLSSVASAQGFELERLSLNPGGARTWAAQTGDGLEAMQLRVSLLGHYQHVPLVYSVDGSTVGAYVRSRWTMHLTGAFGVHKYLEVAAQVPVVVAQSGDDLSRFGLAAVSPASMGAPWLQVRSTFLRQSDELPLDLGLSLALSLPAGTTEALTKDPGAGLAFAPKLGLGRAFGPVRVGAEVGALLRGAQVLSPASTLIKDEVGSQFSGALALSTVGLPVNGEVTWRLSAPFTATALSSELLFAVRWAPLKQLELSALGGPGFGKAPGTPQFRALLGVSWTPDF